MPEQAVLEEWLVGRRWFASKARDVAEVQVLDTVPLRDDLALALTEARFQAGTHEIYQLLVAGEDFDVLSSPATAQALAALFREGATVEHDGATVGFHLLDGVEIPAEARAMGAEQSNSSIVFGERLAFKAFRRIEPGTNPELEMLRFLTGHGFPHIPTLAGWYEYSGELMEATLGVLQRFVARARDGWELALDELARDPDGLAERLGDLGRVTGEMHAVLGSDGSDPAFAPEEPSAERLALVTATIDEEIERIFIRLPDTEAVAPIAGRGEEVRDRLRLLSNVGAAGRMIRDHGDFHLGQTLHGPEGWVIIDFEGEPARPLVERRRKRPPLRDVAGMLRSFAYAASASAIQRGVSVPEGWEERARERFLSGYLDAVDPTLLPPSEAATATLLSIYELEKAVYELGYELNNRPEWVGIPVAGIVRLLEAEEHPAP